MTQWLKRYESKERYLDRCVAWLQAILETCAQTMYPGSISTNALLRNKVVSFHSSQKLANFIGSK